MKLKMSLLSYIAVATLISQVAAVCFNVPDDVSDRRFEKSLAKSKFNSRLSLPTRRIVRDSSGVIMEKVFQENVIMAKCLKMVTAKHLQIHVQTNQMG